MFRRLSRSLTLFTFTSDVALTLIALFLAKNLRLILPYGLDIGPQYLQMPNSVYFVVAVIWMVVFLIIPVYDPRRTYRAIDDLQLTLGAIAFATMVFAGVTYFFFRDLSRFLFVYFFVLDVSFLLGMRIVLRIIFRLWHGGYPGSKTRILILGAGRVGQRMATLLRDYSWFGVEVVGFLDDDPAKAAELNGYGPYLGTLDRAPEVVLQHQVDDVIVALPLHAHDRLVNIVHQLQRLSVSVQVIPDLFELSFVKTTVENFDGIPLIGLRDSVMTPFQRATKRAFDIVVGSITLLIASPVMALVAISIKLDSPGPIFFLQERIGENGRVFKMIKFRSMVEDADERKEEVIHYTDDGKILFKTADDPRITRIGKFIRRTSLDELPQFINVLKGDMSLVGPRPEMPWLVDLYEPWQYKRFAVPQGITGWWQVNGRSDKPMHLHIDEDLYYIQHYSLLLDIFILWKTFAAVVKRSGAY